MNLSESLLNLMGYVLADAAYFCHDLEPDELIAPFAIIERDSEHGYRFFEADTQDEAIEKAFEELGRLPDAGMWAFARDGRMTKSSGEKVDVLIIEGWEAGMEKQVTLLQQYIPSDGAGGFRLIDRPFPVVDGRLSEFESESQAAWLMGGIGRNSRANENWSKWADGG